MKNVRWVIQNNLIHENDWGQMQQVCEKLGIEYELVKVLPFSNELPEFTEDEKTNIYYGSTTFMYNLYHQRNKPVGLFFDEDKFSIENYLKHWGEHMLNYGAKVTTFKQFSEENHDADKLWFIRPDADDKSFNGQVMTTEEIKNWTVSFQQYENVILDENKKIVIGEPWSIKKEWRLYIVDGKIVTASMYRKDFRLKKTREDIPENMLNFAEARIKEYQPHDCFAMDIALCGDAYYIIECGCINSVGFYACEIDKYIQSISNYVSKLITV